MVKEKASKVVVHRIELQQKERELLEGALLAYSINRIATPIVDLMKDVSGMIVFASLLTYIGIKVNVAGLTQDSSMGEVIERIDDAIGLAVSQDNVQSVPFAFIRSFFSQLGNQDWRFDLNPAGRPPEDR